MSSSAKYVISFRRRRKQNLISVLGGKCQLCGFNLFPDALEFHHEDGESKEYGLSSGKCKSLERDLDEVKKCFQLCANCHRGVHAGFYKQPAEHVFLADVANSLVEQNIQLKTRKMRYCFDCGTVIHTGSERCPVCSAAAQRKVSRPCRSDLKNQIRNMPFVQIAKKYGVSDNCIRKWCKAEGLPSSSTEIRGYSDDDWRLL